MWLQNLYAPRIKYRRAAAVNTVQRWSLRCARDARSPRYWVRSSAPRYLPSIVTIKRRSGATTTWRRHVTWPLLNALRMLILVSWLKNYRSSSRIVVAEGSKTNCYCCCCARGQLVAMKEDLFTWYLVCTLGLSSQLKQSKSHSTRQAAGAPTDPPLYHWHVKRPWRSLVDKRPVLEVISIWWWASCDKTNSTSKAEHTRARIYCGSISYYIQSGLSIVDL